MESEGVCHSLHLGAEPKGEPDTDAADRSVGSGQTRSILCVDDRNLAAWNARPRVVYWAGACSDRPKESGTMAAAAMNTTIGRVVFDPGEVALRRHIEQKAPAEPTPHVCVDNVLERPIGDRLVVTQD